MDSKGDSLVLLRRAQSGDREALGDLVDRYGPRLLARIRLMLGKGRCRDAESADFVQNVLLATARRIETLALDDERTLLRWMTAVARNEIRMAVRGQRERSFSALSSRFTRGEITDERVRTPSSELGAREEAVLLAEALEDLSEAHRMVIELRSLERLGFGEVGRRMGRSEDAARKLHFRALRSLCERMDAG